MSNGILSQPQGPLHYFIGFNLYIDRLSTLRLMSAIGVAIEKGAQSITLCMSSNGGAPDQAFYVYELLKGSPIPITTHNVGIVQSAAISIFLAGSTRFAVQHATFLMHRTVHNPQAGTSYGQDLLDHSLESLHADDERAMAVSQPLKTVRRWFGGQRLRSTDFATKHGFIHGVQPVSFPAQSYFFQVMVG
jgi:ATP-dependent Clp protease, protease subunit